MSSWDLKQLASSAMDFLGFAARKIQPHFQPTYTGQGCADAIVDAISAAKKTILVQAYGFTSVPIAQALIAAKKHRVEVTIILDSSDKAEAEPEADMSVCQASACKAAGIDIFIDAAHAIAHNKVMVIDDAVVLTGSYNFTTSAEFRNAENMVLLRDAMAAASYRDNWQWHRAHSTAFV